MNKEFLRKVGWEAHYTLKAGTSTSFIFSPYLQVESIQDKKQKAEATSKLIERMQAEGKEMLLPFRICFINGDDSAPVINTGRGARKKVAQLKSHFTLPEVSPYKIAKPYKVCTSVWQVEGRRCFFYGTIGITLTEGLPPKDNGDLVIFYTDDWKEVEVFIFKGLNNPNDVANLQEVVTYVEGLVQR